ncbi:hypothetical protein SAMN05444391_0250 [Thermocrinis minervae]|uniref:Rod shape-determining protein MreD n=1 Tax=Thermocrinis minervae TaxID=381751 RepID=A0A1M6QI44_9AQUI|nr:hypothetical protein SAMN05444391_0250 [Thermocrinis minervae]
MKFYFLVLFIILLQSILLVGIFPSVLYVPNFLFIMLFVKAIQNGDILSKAFISSLLLDILYDTLGWVTSSHMLSLFLLKLFRSRFDIASKLSVVILGSFFILLEFLIRFLLFRIKYYYPFHTGWFMFMYLLDFVYLVYMSRKV